MFFNRCDGLSPVPAFGDDLNIGGASQQRADALPRQRLVVHDDRANLHEVPVQFLHSNTPQNDLPLQITYVEATLRSVAGFR